MFTITQVTLLSISLIILLIILHIVVHIFQLFMLFLIFAERFNKLTSFYPRPGGMREAIKSGHPLEGDRVR